MNQSAETKLAALRHRFEMSLPARLDAIEKALEGDPYEIERLFHSLAGTAGTYGFSAISALARRGEESAADRVSTLIALRHAVEERPLPKHENGPSAGDSSPSEPALSEVDGRLGMTRRNRILCLEDDPDQAAYVAAILQGAQYETAMAHDVAEFARVLEQFHPDLLLLDVTLPDGSGLDLAAALRRAATHAALPIVFLTGRGSIGARLDGIRAGADDYLVKPVERDLLLATVAARLERARTVRNLIERDGLTLAHTRAAFLRSMEAAVDDHARSGMPYCLVMVDIDHFKSINDTYGHPIGDRVLSLFGRFLRANVRMEDVVGRCGGEEFGVLLAGVGPDEARSLIERLLDRFARIPHAARGGERFHVTFSAGVAMLDARDDAESWRQRADDACYGAKRAGRARVEAA